MCQTAAPSVVCVSVQAAVVAAALRSRGGGGASAQQPCPTAGGRCSAPLLASSNLPQVFEYFASQRDGKVFTMTAGDMMRRCACRWVWADACSNWPAVCVSPHIPAEGAQGGGIGRSLARIMLP